MKERKKEREKERKKERRKETKKIESGEFRKPATMSTVYFLPSLLMGTPQELKRNGYHHTPFLT